MKSVYNISIVDDILLESISDNNSFYEFSNTLNELNSIVNFDFYLFEKVKDTTPNLKSFAKGVKKNTLDTTKDVAVAYGNITSANSNLIKASWDIVMRLVNLISRTLGYVINKITDIPRFILRTADRVMDIPGEVKAKIKGNITLHITASDIEMIYNKLLMNRIREYITLASGLSKGEFWSTFTKKRVSEKSEKSNILFGTNDMELCRKMDKVYEHFKNTEFTPTIVTIKDDSVANVYFGNSKSINFTDNYGKNHECNYYEALNIMIKDLELMKDELKDVHVAIGDKLRLTEANQNYNKLDGHSKYRLNTTLNQITKVVAIIGNFIKYITEDLSTLNNSINKILNKNSNAGKINAKSAANKSSDKVNTKL